MKKQRTENLYPDRRGTPGVDGSAPGVLEENIFQ
jgi:hypothetical protein